MLESPRFVNVEAVYLVFDLYQRSKEPQLKASGVPSAPLPPPPPTACLQVCINSFDDCPYTSPELSSREYWRLDQKVLLDTNAQKVSARASLRVRCATAAAARA